MTTDKLNDTQNDIDNDTSYSETKLNISKEGWEDENITDSQVNDLLSFTNYTDYRKVWYDSAKKSVDLVYNTEKEELKKLRNRIKDLLKD